MAANEGLPGRDGSLLRLGVPGKAPGGGGPGQDEELRRMGGDGSGDEGAGGGDEDEEEPVRTDLLPPLCVVLVLVLWLAYAVANPAATAAPAPAASVSALAAPRAATASGRRWFAEHAEHHPGERRRQMRLSGRGEDFTQWTTERSAQQRLWNIRDLVTFRHARGGVAAERRAEMERHLRRHGGRGGGPHEPPPPGRENPRQYGDAPEEDPAAHAGVRTGVEHPVPVVWYGPVWSSGGFGHEIISFLQGLAPHREEFPLSFRQCGDAINDEFIAGLRRPVRDLLKSLFRSEERADASVAVCHVQPDMWYSGKRRGGGSEVVCPEGGRAAFRVGRVMFETDRFPERWLGALNSADELWVPTHFHRRTFARHGVDASRLWVVPEAVDVRRFDPAAVYPYDLPAYSAFTFKFLSIFKWEDRKGWRTLLGAYAREFTADDNVALYILTHPAGGFTPHGKRGHYYDEAASFINSMGLPAGHRLPRIYFLREDIADRSMPALYKAADAFVLPTRGEGWGLPQVEAMAMGLPVITTNWSGPTEYLSEENGYPLRVDELDEALPDWPGHRWAKPSVSHLMELMRHVSSHKNREETLRKGHRARADVVSKFCKRCVSDVVLVRLRAIADKLRRRGGRPPPPPAQADLAEAARLARSAADGRNADESLMTTIRRAHDPNDAGKASARLAGAQGRK